MVTQNRISVLVVDDEEDVRSYLKTVLDKEYEVLLAKNGTEALDIVSSLSPDVVLLDVMLSPGENGLDVLKKLKARDEDVDVVIISGVRMVQTVVEAMKAGASDYVNKPFQREELFLALHRVLQKRALEKKNLLLSQELNEEGEDPIIGHSEGIRELKEAISKLKGQNVNVFLLGETGTGKEMFARRLHKQENDPARPFVSVSCAAIPENLLESVLFGHERGAFTGATERRLGKFELANGGDIFLDEINCLSSELQAKLLRVLEEKEVERIGSSAPKKIVFRVISAANENIMAKIAREEFRNDLFYRLNAVTLEIPSLNERREDIIPLAEHFLWKFRRSQEPKQLSPEVKEILKNHSWRGNVRELRNTIENIIIFSKGSLVLPKDIPFLRNGFLAEAPRPQESHEKPSVAEPAAQKGNVPSGKYDDVLQEFERELLLRRLEKNRWSKTRTCHDLGITRNKLYRRMAELGIEL